MEELRLSDEMTKYGYVFSRKKSVAVYTGVVLFTMALGVIFGLNLVCRAILAGACTIMLPFFIRNSMKNRYNQQRFSDENAYIEQFLYSFRRSKKILTTLSDVRNLFGEGEMKQTIGAAIDHILHTYSEEDTTAGGLALIEEAYPSAEVRMVHTFALEAERLGGDCENSINLLLNFRRMWADRAYELMQEKKKNRRDIFLSIAVSMALCSAVFFLAKRLNMDFSKNPFSLAVTTAVLLLDLAIFYKADTVLSSEEEQEEGETDEDWTARYHRAELRETGTALERLNGRTAAKIITKQVEKDFPQWLMQVSLLLQTENVPVTVIRSYEYAPAVLRYPLRQFIIEMKKEPDSIRPYLDFLSDYNLPEVRSTMKMLYSLSVGSGGDAATQIADIIRRNQILSDKAERARQQDRLSGMYALFLAPQLTGGLKLLCDMILLFASYMGRAGTF